MSGGVKVSFSIVVVENRCWPRGVASWAEDDGESSSSSSRSAQVERTFGNRSSSDSSMKRSCWKCGRGMTDQRDLEADRGPVGDDGDLADLLDAVARDVVVRDTGEPLEAADVVRDVLRIERLEEEARRAAEPGGSAGTKWKT